MSKFKPGDKVTITSVPHAAAGWGVSSGMQAEIIPIKHTESAAYAENVGLVMIRLTDKRLPSTSCVEFWWSEQNLKLTSDSIGTREFPKRYAIAKFGVCRYIHDTSSDRIFGFGSGLDFSFMPSQAHRSFYGEVDAIHLIEWLNERTAGYPSGPPLLVLPS